MCNNTDKNIINYKFCLPIDKWSANRLLAQYFQAIAPPGAKDKILTAARAYWEPLAVSYMVKDEKLVLECVINSMYRLTQQIHSLKFLDFHGLYSASQADLSVSAQEEQKLALEFRTQVNQDSPYWFILNYFQSKQTAFQESEMIVWAVRAYWQPLAAIYLGDCSCEKEWNEIVSKSCSQLSEHINYLQLIFDGLGIHRESIFTPLSSSNNQSADVEASQQIVPINGSHLNSPPSIRGTQLEGSSANEGSSILSQLDPELAPREEDELIDQMFSN